MDYFSVEKNKDFWITLAVNIESLAANVNDRINHTSLDFFLEFLRGYTNIFNNKSHTNHNLCGLIQNEEIVVVKGDKISIEPKN